jgi:hypothetical protein
VLATRFTSTLAFHFIDRSYNTAVKLPLLSLSACHTVTPSVIRLNCLTRRNGHLHEENLR